jgi:transcriptional regulator with XRE-family HTH domain
MATMPVMVKIGERLKDLRIQRALTQEELGEQAGIGKNTVNRLEQDKTDPRPSTLRKLAAALEVDPAELVRGGRP